MCGRKGGPGKTSLAVSIASEFYARGYRVLIVDTDKAHRGSAGTWADIASEHGHAGPVVVRLGDSVRRELPLLAADYDLVIVDTPGAAEPRTIHALGASDLALMPCNASAVETFGLEDTIEQVRNVQASRPSLASAVLVTRVDKRTTAGLTAHVRLQDFDEPMFTTELPFRTTYDSAFWCGLGVTAFDSTSDAAHEVRRLCNELGALLGFAAKGGNKWSARK